MLFLTFSALVFVPRFICSLEALRLIFATVTLQTAVLAVMTAVPPLTARTFPAAFTVTTDGRLLLQVTVLSAASAGSTPALRTAVLLGSSTSSVLFRVIPDASIAGVTVTLQTAVFPPAVAVMFAVPSAAAVATVSLSDFHVTVLSVAFSGSTAAVSFSVAPAARVSSVLFKVMDVTSTDGVPGFPPGAV